MLKIILDNKQYKTFIDFARKTCDSVSLVFKKDETDNSQYAFQEIYHIVSESVIKKESIDVHPNTGSCFENADILYLRTNTSVISFLKQANGIFDWDGKKLPEELCFYRDEKIWFSCICHERLLHIHNETSDDYFYKESSFPMYYATALYIGGIKVTDLSVPSTVTKINPFAFYSCDSLTSVYIPDSVTEIGDCAFAYCDNLVSVSVGNGVTKIGDSAFYCCESLAKLKLGKKLKQ